MNVSQPNSHYIQILCLETERQLIVTRKISQNIGLITLFNILRSRKDMSCTLDPGVENFFSARKGEI